LLVVAALILISLELLHAVHLAKEALVSKHALHALHTSHACLIASGVCCIARVGTNERTSPILLEEPLIAG